MRSKLPANSTSDEVTKQCFLCIFKRNVARTEGSAFAMTRLNTHHMFKDEEGKMQEMIQYDNILVYNDSFIFRTPGSTCATNPYVSWNGKPTLKAKKIHSNLEKIQNLDERKLWDQDLKQTVIAVYHPMNGQILQIEKADHRNIGMVSISHEVSYEGTRMARAREGYADNHWYDLRNEDAEVWKSINDVETEENECTR